MKTYLAIYTFLFLMFAFVPLQTDAASSSRDASILEEKVYITPKGTPVIRPPKGWTVTELKDESPSAYVLFTSPDKTMEMQVLVNQEYSEADTALSSNKRIIDLYGESKKIGGKKISGSVVYNKRTKIGIAHGFSLEMKRTDLGGKFRIRHVVVDTVGPDYSYMVMAKIPERKWKKNKRMIETSFKTLQIPDSFSVRSPIY